MKKYVFKLEALYVYRQRLEEICRKEFSVALARLDEEEKRLTELNAEHRRSGEAVDGMMERGADMDEVLLFNSYMKGLRRHIAGQREILKSVREALEAKRQELLEASRSKKIIEVMKEKSYSSYIEQYHKEDQKNTDDMVTTRFKRGVR